MTDSDARIAALEGRVASLERRLDRNHNFSLRLFSCVINLWALAIEMRDQMPDGPAKSTFLRELGELQDNINETQKMSDDIVEFFE